MRCFHKRFVPVLALAACGAALAQGPSYNLGRTPTQEEIKAWDVAVGTEGKELPPGSGTAKEGAKIYVLRCARCHGPTGAEEPAFPFMDRLVGGKGTLNTPRPVVTVGSYWAFATSIWDFINRAMPYGDEAGSLSADQVYALTAYLLFKNDIIKEDEVIDAKTLPKVQMPNRNGFIPQRPVDWKAPSGKSKRAP
jgi:cytochrome c